jgi:hypothetical protein
MEYVLTAAEALGIDSRALYVNVGSFVVVLVITCVISLALWISDRRQESRKHLAK